MDSKLTLHPTHRGVAYLEYKGEQQPVFYYPEGLYVDNLYTCYEQIDCMFSHHRKVTVVLIQFHQRQYSTSNQMLSRALNRLISTLKNHYSTKRIGYFWAREEGVSKAPHYHIAIFLDGSVCQSTYHVLQHAQSIWSALQAGNNVWQPKRNLYLLNRGDSDRFKLRAARMRISYAAKKTTKETISSRTRKFGSSQLKVNKITK